MGRKPKAKNLDTEVLRQSSQATFTCCHCGEILNIKNFYKSNSVFFSETSIIPWCKNCISEIYEYYCDKYKKENPDCDYEKKSIQRLCMAFDMYFSEESFNSAIKITSRSATMSLLSAYLKNANLHQNIRKSYDETLLKQKELLLSEIEEEQRKSSDKPGISKKIIKFWGGGFSEQDYEYLQNEYEDWTTRHECNTKAQEEVFKQICFNQLELQKATVSGNDTKDLRASFQKLLETANLQPKQNKKDTLSDAQTFGTLIDKWETTRPIPEVDPDLKDVDKIGLYIDTFFKGHLAKMMGLKNGLSRLYDKYMAKYTVNKPEYNDDGDSEILFDSIFGNQVNMEDD